MMERLKEVEVVLFAKQDGMVWFIDLLITQTTQYTTQHNTTQHNTTHHNTTTQHNDSFDFVFE